MELVKLKQLMQEAVDSEEFEKAAELRDRIKAIEEGE
jgi:protein-arginine kinase activator protein McsA